MRKTEQQLREEQIKAERLAVALRDNLRRRKAQSRTLNPDDEGTSG